MKYSYVDTKRKSIFTSEMQLLLLFFTIAVAMLLLTSIFLFFKDFHFKQQQRNLAQKEMQLRAEIENMENKIVYIQEKERQAEKIFTQNSVLKDSITNLFDLIPERITISEAKLLSNGLIFYGITPNKDVYNFMLQAPLRSIFHKTYSSFYPYENGWLRFVSTNYIKEDEEFINAN